MTRRDYFSRHPYLVLICSCLSILTLSISLNLNGSPKVSAATTDTAASILIDGGVIKNTIRTESGETAYNSYKIAVKADDIESYSLQITAADGSTSNLLPENGTTQITGASGRAGNNLADNTWGYGWSDMDTAVDTISYYTLPAYGTNGTSISTGLLESAKVESVDMVKKLTFAAKFGDGAAPGHYTTTVLLSLAVSPKTVANINPWSTGVYSGITDMQEMSPEVCDQVATPSASVTNVPTLTLTDNRDSITYTISKLKDGKCWMSQNLRLSLAGRTLTTSDSDVTANWASTSGSSAHWSGSASAPNVIKYYCDTADNNYGCYYSWGAAVAGQVSDLTSNSANQSICPKGWRLPTTSDYQNLTSGISSSELLITAPYNFTKAGYAGGGNKIGYAGGTAYYWASTIVNDTNAYSLDFDASRIIANSSTNARFYGFSVRCVARQ